LLDETYSFLVPYQIHALNLVHTAGKCCHEFLQESVSTVPLFLALAPFALVFYSSQPSESGTYLE
jgi:hypothetical protein